MAISGALSIVFWVLLAFSSHPVHVRAQSISFTNVDYTVTTGSPFAISWYGNGEVSYFLLQPLWSVIYHLMAMMLTPLSFSRLPYHS